MSLPPAIRDRAAGEIRDGIAAARRSGTPLRFALMEALRGIETRLTTRGCRQRNPGAMRATFRLAHAWGQAANSCREFPMSSRPAL